MKNFPEEEIMKLHNISEEEFKYIRVLLSYYQNIYSRILQLFLSSNNLISQKDWLTGLIITRSLIETCWLDIYVSYKSYEYLKNDDFNNFLPEVCDNKYNKLNNGVLFLHNNFPSDNQKMNNRIALFKTILERTTDKITFVRKSHGSHHHSEYKNVVNDIDDMINLNLLLSKRYPSLVYEIHIILICDKCFTGITTYKNLPTNIKIYNISRPYPVNVDVTNPYYFDELCNNIFK
jgi:hypothetical protein